MVNILNNSNINKDTASGQEYARECEHKNIIYKYMEPTDVIEYDEYPDENNNKIEILNNGVIQYKNTISNKTQFIRMLRPKEVEYYKDIAKNMNSNFEDAIKESKKLDLERKAHQVRK